MGRVWFRAEFQSARFYRTRRAAGRVVKYERILFVQISEARDRGRQRTGLMNGCGEPRDDGRDAAAVNYKTRKRPADTVYTITLGGDADPRGSPCACCRPPGAVPEFVDGPPEQHQQRRRPRTWTCGTGGIGGGGGGSASLTRSRTFTSNYERAISSLLWQPYECRSSSNSLNDDGDVAVWLNAASRYEPLSSRSSLSLSTIPR